MSTTNSTIALNEAAATIADLARFWASVTDFSKHDPSLPEWQQPEFNQRIAFMRAIANGPGKKAAKTLGIPRAGAIWRGAIA